MTLRNGARMRKNKNKPGPSGMSRNEAFSLPEKWGGRNCLLPVNVNIIRDIKDAMGGDEILEFTTAEFSEQCKSIFDELGFSSILSFENVWDIFTAMLPHVPRNEDTEGKLLRVNSSHTDERHLILHIQVFNASKSYYISDSNQSSKPILKGCSLVPPVRLSSSFVSFVLR